MNKEEKIILTNEFVNSDFNEILNSKYQVFHFPMISFYFQVISIGFKEKGHNFQFFGQLEN